MARLRIAAFVIFGAVCISSPAEKAVPPDKGGMKLKFKNSPMELVLDDYSEKTRRTLLPAPNLPKANITLEGQNDLTMDEYLQAIDTVLAMNGITLLRVGEKFLKVVPIAQARQEEMPVRSEESIPKDNSLLVSQMIPLKYINITEAQNAINALKHPYAQVHMFERINSILLTDTAANVARIMEVLGFIDQPAEAKEEPIIIPIRYAQAAEIKRKLEELIAESQKEAEKSTVPQVRTSGQPGVVQTTAPTRTIPGVIRAKTAQTAEKTATAPAGGAEDLIELVEKGLIIGKVKIIADDRTNLLILITRKENMKFFDKIIKVLDVETAPDVVVKIIRLEYADAETVAGTINSLIGGKPAEPPKEGAKPGEPAKGAALAEYVQKIEKEPSSSSLKEKSKVGELSAANVKILADKRTNALLIMASKADMAALDELIKSMDIMLSQVLVEVVIFKITLSDNMQRGVDWVQRALLAYETGSDGTKSPKFSWAGSAGGGKYAVQDPTSLTSIGSLASSGNNLTYYFSFYGANLDAVISFLASDSRTKIMASPQILTVDNKAATVNVTQERFFYNGQKWISQTTDTGNTGGAWQPDYQMKKIGTKLTVTPHINEKRFVMMEIAQTFERPGSSQNLGSLGSFETVDSAELTAAIFVRSGETIVLGGMVNTEKKQEQAKVPLLGDIPIVGNLFKYKSEKDDREETVVFITPYVVDSTDEIWKETKRMKNAVNAEDLWPKGWSDSKLSYTKEPAKPHGTFTFGSEPEKQKQPAVQKMSPEMKLFIERQEARWNRTFKEIDEQVDREIKEQDAKKAEAGAGQTSNE